MDIPKFNNGPFWGKKVLFAPLDWGLGHATRCIPIINALLKRGSTLIIAVSGPEKAIFAAEFPQIRLIDLPGYRVRLGPSRSPISTGLLRQLPRLWRVIRAEHRWLKDFCRTEPVDLILSDNRYGFYHPGIHSVFLTHQLFISSGLGDRIDRWLLQLHYRLIGRFSECWVPDNADHEKSAAGRLSHPPRTPPFPVSYLGLLSRFAGPGQATGNAYAQIELLVMLSGPEPGRTLVEKMILEQLKEPGPAVLLLRGRPSLTSASVVDDELPQLGPTVRIVNHLPSAELRSVMMAARVIICRSGYSTLMDLIAVQRTALLLPTPGQPEQEYLAVYMEQRGWMRRCRQQDFSLAAVLADISKAGTDSGFSPPSPEGMFFTDELPDINLP